MVWPVGVLLKVFTTHYDIILLLYVQKHPNVSINTP